MTLERIENHIVEQARTEAGKSLEKARERARSLTTQAQQQADEQYNTGIERLKAELANTFAQETGKLRAQHRITLLNLKTGILEDVFKRAVEKLLTNEGYWDLIRRQLQSVAGESGQVRCRTEHAETIGKMIAELNDGSSGKIAPLGADPAPIRGGFIFHGDEYDIDFSLESQLEGLRERVLPELIAHAFPET